MLDPLTSLSLAANIVELITFTRDVIKTGHALVNDGSTADNDRLQAVATSTKQLCSFLAKQHQQNFNKYKKDLAAWQLAEDNHVDSRAPVIVKSTATLRKPHRLQEDDDSESGSDSDASSSIFENQVVMPSLESNTRYQRAGKPEEVMDHNPLVEKASTLANDVITGLQKLSIQPGRKRKRDAVLPTIKTVIKLPTLRKWNKQLQEIQQPLTLHLATLQYQNVSQALSGLQASPMCNEASERLSHVERVQDTIIETCSDANASTLDSIEARIAFEDIKARAPDAMKKTLAMLRSADLVRRILPSLQYEEIYDREDRIHEAHATTFEWIFRKQGLKFAPWATQNDDGLFWITGKPGSGKSTLMKFIVNSPRTQKLLEMWAGKDRLCIAHHYFWCSGSSLQKSLCGMLRSLLYQLFQQCPELLRRILPCRFWKSDAHTPTKPWTMTELTEITKALRGQKDLGVKICLFIDGLDEYEGEHSEVAELLDYIAEPSFLKICVSSRPWNVFTNAFGEKKQLAVQALTQGDLRCYISDTLRDSKLFLRFQQADPDGAKLLFDEVCGKAQGVFLWVYLVGLSLRRGLENNDTLDILLARVREMPNDLDGFFRRMFERIEPVYKVQTARILLSAYHADYALPLSAPELLSQEIVNPDYAVCTSVQTDEIVVSHERIRQVRTLLDARCGDLLEASCHGISCLHRTVKDFLRQDDIAPNLRALAGASFDAGLCLSRLALAILKRGEAGDLDTQVQRIFRAEKLVGHNRLPAFVSLLENLDGSGKELFKVGYNLLGNSFYPGSKLAMDLRYRLQKIKPELSSEPYHVVRPRPCRMNTAPGGVFVGDGKRRFYTTDRWGSTD